MTLSRQMQGGAILEGVGLSRRHFMQLAGAATAVGALGIGTTGLASAAARTGTGTFTGSLAANSGGSYADYVIAKPTGDKITITMTYSPYNASEAHGVGFEVWQNGKRISNKHGQATGLKDHVDSNVVKKTLTPKVDEPLLIQVFNFTKADIDYTLTVAGNSAVAAPLKSAKAPEEIPFKNPESGTLDGINGGTTVSYVIATPTGTKITITLTYSPWNAGDAHRVGFTVWQNGKRIANKHGLATGFKDHTNSNQPSAKVTPSAGSPLLIEVFNYTDAPIDYTLTVK